MTRRSLSRKFAVFGASMMAVFFGFPGLVAAEQARIQNTGPDSYNKISMDYDMDCDVDNTNAVNVSNNTVQNAHTGDASVGGNWGAYNPTLWQARGHSYAEWEAAVNSYMQANQSDWQNNWNARGSGGGNTTAGDATSGDASNTSNTSTRVGIDNSGACGGSMNGQPNNPNNPGSSGGGNVLGASTVPTFGSGGSGGGNVLGAQSGSGLWGVSGGSGSGMTGSGLVNNPTTSGGGGSGSGGAGGSSSNASISNTGPDSYNKINFSSSSSVQVNNTNNVNTSNTTVQNASSGSATVAGNTSAGNAGTGDSDNHSSTQTNTSIHN